MDPSYDKDLDVLDFLQRRGRSMESSLDDLLVLVARGDRQAFESLYDRLVDRVFGVMRSVLRDPARSEEVTQEVMLEIWRTAPRFERSRGTAST